MKKMLSVFFVSIMLISISCGGGGGGGGSDGSTQNESPLETLISTKSIGIDGGILSDEDISLTVPMGSFTSESELTLSIIEDVNPFGDDGLSAIYRIGGIPIDYSLPLQLKFKYQGTLNGNVYIAIGEEYAVDGTQEFTTSYRMVEALKTDEFITCELPPPNSDNFALSGYQVMENDGMAKGSIQVAVGESGPMYISSEGHFNLYDLIPSEGFTSDRVKLLSDLEEAYQEFLALGFKYDGRDFKKDPVKVNLIKRKGSDRSGYFYPSRWGNGYLEFHLLAYVLKGTVYQNFFHLVQDLYDPRWKKFTLIGGQYIEPNFQWLNVATGAWTWSLAGETNISESYLIPDVIDVSQGLHIGSDKNAWEIGFSRVIMIDYLEKKYGKKILPTIYDNIKEGELPVDALIKSTAEPYLWLDDYYREYILRNIFAYPSEYRLRRKRIELIESLESEIIIDSVGSTKNYPLVINDLSSFLTTLSINDNTVDKLILELNDDLESTINVFKYKEWLDDSDDPDPYTYISYDIEHMETHYNTVTIPNVITLSRQGWQLLVLITNSVYQAPYEGETTINLSVKAEIGLDFPLIFEGKGNYKVTYNFFNDFSCEEQTDYYLKLDTDGSTYFSYLENVRGQGIYVLGELVDMVCIPTSNPNAIFRNGSHDFIKTFRDNERGQGCSWVTRNTLEGSFTEFHASGKGTYYRCTSGTGTSETIEIEFENIPEVQ